MNFEDISKKVKQFGKDAAEEVQKLNEIRILKGKISDAKKQIAANYTEIGKKIYEQYKENAMEGMESEIQTITEKLSQILELEEQIRGVKGVVLCPCCNMEVAAGEKFCSNCGNEMPVTEVCEEAAEETECACEEECKCDEECACEEECKCDEECACEEESKCDEECACEEESKCEEECTCEEENKCEEECTCDEENKSDAESTCEE